MNSWFTSDWHLDHKNILRYDNRPFSTIDEHNEAIITNFNSLVRPMDNVYFLGDFSLGNVANAEAFLQRLNGRLHFIQGNHDTKKHILLFQKYGNFLDGLADLKIDGHHLVLCHYRLEVWNRSHHGSWCIHGHSHHNLPKRKHCLDVGVNGESYNYQPISFDQIKELIPRE